MSGPRSVGAVDANGVGMPETAWVDKRRGVGWDLGRSALWMRTALGFRQQRGSIGVGMWVNWRRGVGLSDSVCQTASRRTASGPPLVGATDANSVGMLATAWVDWRRGVSRAGESMGRSASGRQLGWGLLFEHGVEPSVGFCWR